MVNSAKRTLNILSLLADSETPMTGTAIAAALGINRSTCAHLISTLVECGYVERVSHTAGYILGPEAYVIAKSSKYGENLISVCKPVMRWLFQKIQRPIILATIKGDQKFIISTVEGMEGEIKIDRTIRRDHIYSSATGRAILANMSKDEVLKVYKKLGNPGAKAWAGITSQETLFMELGKIDPKGVVVSEYLDPKKNILIIGIGAAIFKGANCMGAVGVALLFEPESDRSAECSRAKKYVAKAAQEITCRLNASS